MQTQITCGFCQSVHASGCNDFTSISVSFPKKLQRNDVYDLYSMLWEQVAEEEQSGFPCTVCSFDGKSQMKNVYKTLPKILVVNILRFEQIGTRMNYRKITNEVIFPTSTIDMSIWTGEACTNLRYICYNMIIRHK